MTISYEKVPAALKVTQGDDLGTVGLCVKMYLEDRWEHIAVPTRRLYVRSAQHLKTMVIWGLPATRLTAGMLAAACGKLSPGVRNQTISLMRAAAVHAASNGVIPHHFLATASRTMAKPTGDWQVWEDSDIKKLESCNFFAQHDLYWARKACLLAAFTGQRLSDIITLRIGQYDDKKITFVQSKTGATVMLPMTPRIMECLPHTLTRQARSMEKVFWMFKTEAQFKGSYYRMCKALGIKKPFHGLRKYCATKLAEKGCTIPEIMSVTGHKSMTTVAMYVKTADKWLLAKQAMEKFDA
jgi:integrase